MVRIRYIVNNVSESVKFYTENLAFELVQQFGPAIAILQRDGVQLLVSGPISSAAREMPDGTKPSPGGWARFQIVTNDIETMIADLKDKGVSFKNELFENQGRKQILCEDPSGNLIELFEGPK